MVVVEARNKNNKETTMMRLRSTTSFLLLLQTISVSSFVVPKLFTSSKTTTTKTTTEMSSKESDQIVATNVPTTSNIKSDFEVSWEPQLAQRIYKGMKEKQKFSISSNRSANTSRSPYMVAFAGIPGSGKSTSAKIIQDLLQNQFDEIEKTKDSSPSSSSSISSSSVMVMPMDGYHLPLATLESKPNAKELIYKRGAPETFDPISLLNDLKRIRNNDDDDNDTDIVHIPGFDHAIGDPQPNAYSFHRRKHQILICEGLYLLHQEDTKKDSNKSNNVGWNEEIQKQFDLTIFINANVDTCIDRLKIRNKCIPGYTPEEIDIRCDVVDRGNALLVMESKDRAMIVVDSVVAS